MLRQIIAWFLAVVDASLPRELMAQGRVAYFFHWLAIMTLIVLTACVVRKAAEKVAIRADVSDIVGFSRADKAEKVARRICPDSCTPRSAVAQVNHWDVKDKRQRRELMKAQSLQSRRSVAALEHAAELRYTETLLMDLVRNVTRQFGGGFVYAPGLRTAFRPLVMITAAAAVLWVKPIPHQPDTMRSIVMEVWQTTTGVTPSRLLPVVLLLVGVLVVTRPSTLIDVIRARDEAAKDANRLLAELSGRLMTLEIAVYRWRKQLLATRELLIQEWVNGSSGGEYQWHHAGGVNQVVERGWDKLDDAYSRNKVSQGMEKHTEELRAAIQQIAHLKDKIGDRSLYPVVWRMTARVSTSFWALELRSDYGRGKNLERAYYTPQSVVRFLESEKHMAVRPTEKGDQLALRFYEESLEKAAYNIVRVLDYYAAELMVQERHLRRVRIFLTKRVVGSFWTRTLSAVQK